MEKFRDELRKQLESTHTLKVSMVEGDRKKPETTGLKVRYYAQIGISGDTTAWLDNHRRGSLGPAVQFFQDSIPELSGIKYALSKLLSQLD